MLVKFTTISDLHCFSRGCAPPRTTHQALLLSSGDVLAGKCWTIRSAAAIRSQLRWPAYYTVWRDWIDGVWRWTDGVVLWQRLEPRSDGVLHRRQFICEVLAEWCREMVRVCAVEPVPPLTRMQYRADRTPQLTLRRVAVRPALVVCTMPARQTNLKSNFILNFSEKKMWKFKKPKKTPKF